MFPVLNGDRPIVDVRPMRQLVRPFVAVLQHSGVRQQLDLQTVEQFFEK